MLTLPRQLSEALRLTPAQFAELCAANPEAVLELAADGRLIEVIAAEEELMEVQGDLHRYAWHIGNRHAPCQIEGDRLLIRRDHVLRAMLEWLGAVVKDVVEPFTPEGGAYGMGRVMGHAHGAAPGHGHGPGHDHHHHDEENVLAGLGRHAG